MKRQAAKTLGLKVEELFPDMVGHEEKGTRIPTRSLYLFNIFTKLSERRCHGMSAWPITESEIWYYQKNRRLSLSAWQVDLICEIDREYLKVIGQQEETPVKSTPKRNAKKKK